MKWLLHTIVFLNVCNGIEQSLFHCSPRESYEMGNTTHQCNSIIWKHYGIISMKCFIFGKSWLWKPRNRCLRMDVVTCIVSLRLSMEWQFHYSLHYQFHYSFHICNGGWREWNWAPRCIPFHPISLFSSGFSMKWRRTHEAPISLFS